MRTSDNCRQHNVRTNSTRVSRTIQDVGMLMIRSDMQAHTVVSSAYIQKSDAYSSSSTNAL